jgi:hypothetical protein
MINLVRHIVYYKSCKTYSVYDETSKTCDIHKVASGPTKMQSFSGLQIPRLKAHFYI